MNLLMRILSPNICYLCSNEVLTHGLCATCWSKLIFITQPYCYICSTPFQYSLGDHIACAKCLETPPNFDQCKSIMKYNNHSKKLIMHFKNHNAGYLKKFFVRLIMNHTTDFMNQVDIIMPVPIHKWRMFWRGYNQSELIAKELAHVTGKKYLRDGLLKIHMTKSQSHYKQKDRLQNVKNTFEINGEHERIIKNKNILLVDDVITTGATINECAKVLKNHNAAKVFIITLAKTYI